MEKREGTGWVPVKDFLVEEAGEGKWICDLQGGTILFEEARGRFHVTVTYDDQPGRKTFIGPFASLNDAAYDITHGVVLRRLAELLIDNGILVHAA